MFMNFDKMLVLDIDTINAFMKFGTLYKPETEVIKPNLSIITRSSSKYDIKILSLCDKHFGDSDHAMSETELKINGGLFEIHAEDGTDEAEKIPETLLSNNVIIPTDLEIKESNLQQIVLNSKQIIVEKQSICGFHTPENPGGNPLLIRILDILKPEIVFVQGVYTEYCVKENVMPILAGGDVSVLIIIDAIMSYNPNDGNNALQDLANMGCRFISTNQYIQLLENNFGTYKISY